MIVGLDGVVERKEPHFIHLNVNGVIYEVSISLQSFSAISTQSIRLHISHIVREDAELLFGFIEIGEKTLFERLLKISGVGPKVALAICSTFSPSSFADLIASNDIAMLKKVPGIGPKSAGRILVELSGFDTELLNSGSSELPKASSEAMQALESLGFKRSDISKVLNKCSSKETASLVKEALKKLQ